MNLRTKTLRLAGAGMVVAAITGSIQALSPAHAEAGGTAQASNFQVTSMSPGQDEGTLSSYSQCGTANPNNSAGYYSFPSKQSTIDNGLQTNIGNDQGMLKLTFSLPSSVQTGSIEVTAPNPPRPSSVPASAPWGTVFPSAEQVNPGADSLYGCTVPSGNVYTTLYYAVTISNGHHSYFTLPSSVTLNPNDPSQVQIPFDFSFSGTSSSTMTVYIANVVNPPEGTYNGVNYTVSVTGSTSLPAPGQDSVTFVNTTPDPTTSQLTSSLTPDNPTLTATDVPSDGAVLTATIYDAFYNPVAGESVYIGVAGGPGGAETAPIGSGGTSGGNGEPQTGSNGEAQYYAFGTVATPAGNPDTFFAQDTSSGIFIDQPPPAAPGTLATIPIPITAADPSPPSAGSTLSNVSSVTASGGTYVSLQETQVTADGSSAATITVTLADKFGNFDTNQAIILQPVQPAQPAPSENLKKVVITPLDPPAANSPCTQGPSSQIPGVSCTDSFGTTQFSVTDTIAETVSFEITDLTDGYVLPNLVLPTDAPNIPIVDFLPGPTSLTASTVSVDGGATATVLADGNAQATIDVSLTDAEGNAEVGKVVTVAGNGGTSSVITAATPAAEVSRLNAEGCSIPAAGTTDCNGNAYFTVSDSTVENVTYTATDVTDLLTLNGANQQPVVSYVTGSVSAANSTVSVSPPTVVGDGQGVATVSVTVLDQGNHALDGETVTLDTSSLPSVTSVPGSATTDANGVATFKIRSSSPIGAVSLPVTVGLTQLDQSAGITFAPPPVNSTVSAAVANPQATGSTDEAINVTAADSSSNPIAGLSLELLGGSLPASPPTATTSGAGAASFLVGALLPGTVTYTVVDLSDNDRTLGTVQVTYVPVPDEAHESVVTASPHATYTFVAGQPLSAQSSIVTVALKDASGNPIAGDTVAVTGDSPNATVTPTAGGVSGANGLATFTVTDPNPEVVTFTATDTTTGIGLVQSAQVSFVLRPNEDTTSTIVASPLTVEANGTSSSVVTVTLLNNGALLSGDTVSLSQGQGSSIITTPDPVSNSAGEVQFTVTDLTPQSVAYQATDLTTATELTHDQVVTFTAPPGGSQPAVTGLVPASGPGTGGTQVTITGANFANASDVMFGAQPAPTYTVNTLGTEIVAVSPIPVAAGAVNVTVSGPGGTSPAVTADVFTYTSAPPLQVSSVTPTSGSIAGGTKVILTGTGLASISKVRFGSVAATRFVVNPGGASVTVFAPAVAGPGRVEVVAAAGFGSSVATPMDVFAFVSQKPVPPAIESLAPTHGPLRGGTVVTVRGSNLSRVTEVLFGNVKGSHVAVSSGGTVLEVRSPAVTRAGVVRVTVVTHGGRSSSVEADRFSYANPSPPYHKLAKALRLLDTSLKGGGGPLVALRTRQLTIAGVGQIPKNATAAFLSITFRSLSTRSYLTLFPDGARRPSRPDMSAAAGGTVTRSIEVSTGTRGSISIYDSGGKADLVVVALGYYVPTGPATATRSLFEGEVRP